MEKKNNSGKKFTVTKIHPGLAIYQYERSPFYYARIWNAADKKYIIKSTETESKLDAKKIALELWQTLHSGGQISKTKRDKTFKYWCREFLNHQYEKVKREGYKQRTHDNEVTLLFAPETGITKSLGNRDIATIKQKDVTNYFKKRDADRKTPLTPGTRNKYINVVKKVLLYAYDEDVISTVPAFKTERSSAGDRPRPSFKFHPVVPQSDDEYKNLLKAIRKCRDDGVIVRGTTITQELYDLVVFLVHSFLRPTLSEVFSIRFRDVQIREDLNCLQIEIEKGKTGYRIASSTKEAIGIYKRIRKRHKDLDDDAYVFLPEYSNRNHARRILSNQFNFVLKKNESKKDAYGQDRSLYSLRHLGIQMRLVKSGGEINLFFLAKNCGTSVEMIERFYCKYLPLDRKVIENLQSMPA